MPVVSGKSNLIHDYQAGTTPPDPILVTGKRHIATGKVTNAATDSSGSKYKLVSLPSDCIVTPNTKFFATSWGFAALRVGTFSDVAALASAAAGVTVTPLTEGADASHGKELWQLLGLAADPGGMIDLYAHAIANATGAGSMNFTIEYIYR